MILAQHGILGSIADDLPPTLVSLVGNNPGTTATYTVTPSVTPTDGNLMVIVFGGAQSRTVNSAPSGWTVAIDSGGTGTHYVYTKTASGETGGAYSFTLSGTLQGGITFYEISGIDVGAIYTELIPLDTVADATKTYTLYNVAYPSLVIAGLAGGAFISATIDNSFSLDFTGSQRFNSAHRVYSTPESSQSTTWTLNTAVDVSVTLLVFR